MADHNGKHREKFKPTPVAKRTRPARESRAGLVASRDCRALGSMRERIRTQLQLHELRRLALAAFAVERRTVAGACPHAAALPAGIRIVDAPVNQLGEEA